MKLCLLLCVAAACRYGSRSAQQPRAEPLVIFVNADGNDGWSGVAATHVRDDIGPFATLERARDEVRRIRATSRQPLHGIVIDVTGTFVRREPFVLTSADAGTETSPITYLGHGPIATRILGGPVITSWEPLSATEAERVDPAARDHVITADLASLGVHDFGSAGGGGLELFSHGARMVLARWPNTGFDAVADVPEGLHVDVRGFKGRDHGVIRYQGERPTRWLHEKDLWAHGYWFWDWSDESEQVSSIDAEHHLLRLTPPYHRYGYRAGQRFYIFNALAELDAPGEWWLDREAGRLYWWPPAGANEAQVSVSHGLIAIRATSFVTIKGFELAESRDTAVVIEGSAHVQIEDSLIRNVGGWGVTISGGTDDRVIGSEITGTGEGGVRVSGGDRIGLVPSRHVVERNEVHHYSITTRTERAGIDVAGVGNLVSHNSVHDAPHWGIHFAGNDNVIELNNIGHVCLETNDAGAIYAGRDWSMRGNIIRFNAIHDIDAEGCIAIYLDDMFSGTRVEGNIFYKVWRGTFIGGGRDNIVAYNVFDTCGRAVHVDARGLGWAASGIAPTMIPRLGAMPYTNELWRSRYPALSRIFDEEPAAPRGNVVEHNVLHQCPLDEFDDTSRPLLRIDDNRDLNPAFVEPDRGDFSLSPRSELPSDNPLRTRAALIGRRGPS